MSTEEQQDFPRRYRKCISLHGNICRFNVAANFLVCIIAFVCRNGRPIGTSIIAQEFSPGRSEPTPINEVRQNTDHTLDVQCTAGTANMNQKDNAGGFSISIHG